MKGEERKKTIKKFRKTKFYKRIIPWVFVATMILIAGGIISILSICNELFNFTTSTILSDLDELSTVFVLLSFSIMTYYLGALESYIHFSKNK